MKTRPWVLVTDGGVSQSRSAVAAVRALAAGGYRVAATYSAKHSLAVASRYCERRIRVPALGKGDFAAEVRRELQERPYVCVVATSDLALMDLDLLPAGMLDKAMLEERAHKAGLRVPPTRVFEGRAAAMSADDLTYPVVVKPSVQRFPAFLARARDDIRSGITEDVPVLVQPFVSEPLRAVAGVAWNQTMIAAVHQRYWRTWPPDCGTACAAETIAPDDRVERKVLDLLEDYSGIFQAQFAGDFLIDLNLRPYGSLPLAVAAGANLASIYCDLLRGLAPPPVHARPGVFYRWIEGDLRHVTRSVKSKEMSIPRALAALRPRRRAAHSTESMRDPRPGLARLAYALQRAP